MFQTGQCACNSPSYEGQRRFRGVCTSHQFLGFWWRKMATQWVSNLRDVLCSFTSPHSCSIWWAGSIWHCITLPEQDLSLTLYSNNPLSILYWLHFFLSKNEKAWSKDFLGCKQQLPTKDIFICGRCWLKSYIEIPTLPILQNNYHPVASFLSAG